MKFLVGIGLPLLVLGLVGCGATEMRRVNTGYYYGYQMASETKLDTEPATPPTRKAIEALSRFKRVAFVPPDTCLDMRAGDTSTTVDKRVLRMQCGVTMSELEREAANADFEVVTWQSLKGLGKPLDQAREQKIDLLFEVNELDVVTEGDYTSTMEFRYFKIAPDGSAKPMQVTEQDNEACKRYQDRAMPTVRDMSAVLDIKMVQVSNGSVLWSYRSTQSDSTIGGSPMVRFAAGGVQRITARRPWWPLLVILAGVGLAVNEAPEVGGGAIVGGGLWYLFQSKSVSKGPVTMETPETVLCRRAHFVPPPVPVAASGPQTSDRFVSSTSTRTKDEGEEHRRRLIKASVHQYMQTLVNSARPSQ
jgi:hypothetical protein